MANKKVLVVAPHPDDETLGVGATLFRHREEGDEVYWLIITCTEGDECYTEAFKKRRKEEIKKVAEGYGFCKTFRLAYHAAKLDNYPIRDIVNSISKVIQKVKPEVIYVPFYADVHSDHRITFDAVVSCSKWFRHRSIKKILAYETLSETGFGLDPKDIFQPNTFVDISRYLDSKIEMMKIYSSELRDFPFPRSEETIRSLACLHGSLSGFKAAEAFILLREYY